MPDSQRAIIAIKTGLMEVKMILKTVEVQKVEETIIMLQKHMVDLPALCPRTSNPQPGSKLEISYRPGSKLLEVYSLSEYVQSFVGSQEVRDIEHFIQVIARDCGLVLGVPVNVIGTFILDIRQTVEVEVTAG